MAERRHTVLIVDDEPDILDSLRLALEIDYDVLTATNGPAGLELLSQQEVAVIISDQRMPKMTGVQFLEKAQEMSPNSVRMMLTGFSDFDAIVEAINKGQIYRYISKPWEPRDLELDVKQAVERYELRTSLDQRLRELKTLCEIGITITSELDSDLVIQRILDGVVHALGFDRSILLLVDEAENMLCGRACAGLEGEALRFISDMQYSLDREDVAVVLSVKENRSILVEDVDNSPVALDTDAIQKIGIRSFVTVPLRVNEQMIGVLVADRSGGGEHVTEHDRQLLGGFGAQAAIALENARLYEEALEKKRLEEEVNVAGRIQQYLLPSKPPEVRGMELAGMSRPSRWVSGDYYDFVPDKDECVWVALGDVSGKGIQAGLTMATLRALVRAELDLDHELSQAMRRISEGLFHSTAPEVFATLCFGLLDPADRSFTFVNAGHPPPLLARVDGICLAGEAVGPPVGMDPVVTGGIEHVTQKVILSDGDVLVLYSDGVTEAGDSPDEMFEEERLMTVISENRMRGACAVQNAICEAVDAFVGGAQGQDDLTLVVIGATGEG